MLSGVECCYPAGELEVLLQRAARGRDELELRRLDEAEKRGNRFRCVVQVRDVADCLQAACPCQAATPGYGRQPFLLCNPACAMHLHQVWCCNSVCNHVTGVLLTQYGCLLLAYQLRKGLSAPGLYLQNRSFLQDLDSVHRLEVVHLERFLDGQAQAGKYVPLRDSTLSSKRELLDLLRR